MGEYRFTGPFYNDNEESVYESSYKEVQQEQVTPPPAEKPKKKKGGFGKTILKTICIALIAGAVGAGAFLGVVSAGFNIFGIGKVQQTVTEIQKSDTSQAIQATVNNSIDVSTIAEKCMPSVVSITNKGVQEIRSWFGTYQQETSGSGSGIIIGENDTELLIVTNYHVVSDSQELSVYFSFEENTEGEEENVVSAKIKGYDSQKDLAVISVKKDDIPEETKAQIVIASIGDSSELQVGEQVVAIGNALGYGQSVTTGIVSALNREVSLTGTNGETITNQLIQTDAAINPGNSGGPICNINGEVIGVTNMKLVDSTVEGMGFAIPIEDALIYANTLEKGEEVKRPYLGIGMCDVNDTERLFYNRVLLDEKVTYGVVILEVDEKSSAADAKLKKGDVIIELAGEKISTLAHLRYELYKHKPGESIVVKYIRGDKEKTVTIKLAAKESE